MKVDLIAVGNIAKDLIFDKEYFGGSAGNIAINAQLFGLNCAILSSCGRDHFSGKYLEYLSSVNMDLNLLREGLERLPECRVVSKENHSSSKEWFDNGSEKSLTNFVLSKKQKSIISDSRIIHFTTTPPDLIDRVIQEKNNGALVGYEPGPRIRNDGSFFNMLIFSRVDYLFLNEEEYRILHGRLGIGELAKKLQKQQVIIATNGSRGCKVITADSEVDYAQPRVIAGDKLKDSNGAGDAFIAGFYVAISNGLDLNESLAVGQEFGATSAAQIGAHFQKGSIFKLRRELASYGISSVTTNFS